MKISKKWKIGLFLVCSIVLCKRYAYTIHAEETGPDSYIETSAVNIQKQDENNQPVSGANLQIIDQNNQVKEAWTTDGTTHETSLEPGTYTHYTNNKHQPAMKQVTILPLLSQLPSLKIEPV